VPDGENQRLKRHREMRVAKIGAARIGTLPARQILNLTLDVGGGVHRLASWTVILTPPRPTDEVLMTANTSSIAACSSGGRSATSVALATSGPRGFRFSSTVLGSRSSGGAIHGTQN